MSETMILVLACASGGGIGAIFFGGLWWTVQKGVSSKQSALWFLGSMLLRICIALTGFYFIYGGHEERLLVCLLGFIIARIIVTWLTGSPLEQHNAPAKEIGHAP